MDVSLILSLTKARLGISSGVRDTYIEAIIKGVVSELEREKGINLDLTDYNHIMFAVDYATWRYQSRDKDTGVPRHIQWRLNNLYVHDGGSR